MIRLSAPDAGLSPPASLIEVEGLVEAAAVVGDVDRQALRHGRRPQPPANAILWKIVDRGLSKASGQAPDRALTWAVGACREVSSFRT